jgi:hypothetical protein
MSDNEREAITCQNPACAATLAYDEGGAPYRPRAVGEAAVKLVGGDTAVITCSTCLTVTACAGWLATPSDVRAARSKARHMTIEYAAAHELATAGNQPNRS